MKETFIGEGIVPDKTSFSAAPMATGMPGLPRTFTWRDRSLSVAEVLEEWKESGDCRHGSGERYVRKHWFRIKTFEGLEMKIYFERQARLSGGARWRLYSIKERHELHEFARSRRARLSEVEKRPVAIGQTQPSRPRKTGTVI